MREKIPSFLQSDPWQERLIFNPFRLFAFCVLTIPAAVNTLKTQIQVSIDIFNLSFLALTGFVMANMAQFIFGWQKHVQRGVGANHSHHDMELVYHQSGKGTVYSDTYEPISFEHGQVQFIPAGMTHRQHQQRNGLDHCILFETDKTICKRINHACCYPLANGQYPAGELALLSILPKPQNKAEQSIANHRLTAVLLELLRLGQRLEPQAPPASRREEAAEMAHAYLRTHWREIQQLQQVAEPLDISLDYLRHVYREHYGQTLYQALTQLRIEHACDLLRNSQLPLKAMPTICGFADIQQFSRRFKQITGMAPGGYRKQALG